MIHRAFGQDGETAEELCGATGEAPDAAIDDLIDEDEAPDAAVDEDFEPSLCQVQTIRNSQGLRGQAFYIYSGETVVTRIEMADGSIWFISEPWNENYGPGAGFGAIVPLGTSGVLAGGWAEVQDTDQTGHSQIWTFDADEREEANEFEESLAESTSMDSNGWSYTWDKLRDAVGLGEDGPDLRRPDMTVEMSGHSGELTAGPQVGVPGIFTAPEWVDAEVSGVRTVRTDYGGSLYYPEGGGEDIISENHQVSGNVSGDVGAGVEFGGGPDWSAGIRADRHADGELQGIYLNASFKQEGHLSFAEPFGIGIGENLGVVPDLSTEVGSGRVQNTYVWVEFENDEERALGEQFLEEYGGYDGAFNYFWETAQGEHGFLEEDPGPNGDPWGQLLYDNALAWQTTGNAVRESSSVGANTNLGFPIGPYATAGVGWQEESINRNTNEAWHLGAPQADGTREQLAYEDCTA